MVSDGEKLVSDFEHFSNIHSHPLQTLFRGDRFVDICQNIRISEYQNIAIHNCYPKFDYGAFAIGIKVIKNKKRH